MKPIFLGMFRQVLILNATFLAILLTSGAAFSRFGYQDIAEIFGVFLLGSVLLGPYVTSRSLPMLLSLPFSRNRLILLTSATHIVSAITSGVCIAIFYSVDLYFWQHLNVKAPLLEFFHFLFSGHSPGSILGRAFENPIQVAVLSLLFSFTVLYLLLTTDSQGWGKAQKSVFSRADKKVQRLFIAKVYGLGILVFVLSIKSTFLFNVALLLGVNLFVAALVATSWVFSPFRRKKWSIFACALTAVQVSLLVASCLFSMNSNSGKRRIETVEYLGLVGPGPGADFIRTVVAQPLDKETSERLVKLIGPKTVRGDFRPYVWDANHAPLSYREMIANQIDPGALDWLVYMYDPRTLTQDDLSAMMSKGIMADKDHRWRLVPSFWQWIVVPLSDDFVLEYLRSNDVEKTEFALQYIERHPAEKFFAPVTQGLRKDFPGSVIPKGIRVLSVLTAKSLDYRTYQEEIREGSKSHFEKVDCSGQSLERLVALDDPNKAGFFNRCIRELAVAQANAHAIREADYWYTLPMKKNFRRDLEEAFRER